VTALAIDTATPECPPGARLIPIDSPTYGRLYAVVDEADYEELSQFRWFVARGGNTFYVQRDVRRADGTWTTEKMHRRLMPDAQSVDHVNGNGLDNRRVNLRAATNSQNMANRRGPQRNNTSGYLGVTWHKRAGKWRAQVQHKGRYYYVGLFNCPTVAALHRDKLARELHGEFAALNFPPRTGREDS